MARVTKLDPYLLAVLTVPIVLLLSSHEWLFPVGNTSDSWEFYTFWFEWGRVRDPALYGIGSYAGAAKAARLSWILKGVLAHRLLPPLTAHYTLHLTMLFAAIVLFYLIAKRLFNAHIAFLSTMAFATYSQFHGVPAWDWEYNSHDTIVNFLLALLLLLLAARGIRPHLALAAAGVAAASITQDPYAVPCLPVLVVWYLSLRRGPHTLGLWRSLGYFVVGAAFITVVYCLISYSVGGSLFYYQPMLTALPDASPHALQYRHPSWELLWQAALRAQGFQIPAAMAVAALGMLVYVRRRAQTLQNTVAIATCYVSLLIGIVGGVVLLLGQHDVSGFAQQGRLIAVSLAPAVFLAGAAILATILGTRSYGRTGEILLAGASYVFFVAPLTLWQIPATGSEGIVAVWNRTIGAAWPRVAFHYAEGSPVIWLAIVAPFLVIATPLGLVAHLTQVARRFISALLVIIFLSIANIASALIPLDEYAVKFASCGHLEDQFKAIVESYRAIRAFDPDYGLYLWYKTDDRIPYPIEMCHAYGTTQIQLFDLYRSLWAARYYSLWGPPPVRRRRAEIYGSAQTRQNLRSIVAEEFREDPAPDPMGVLGHPAARPDFLALPHAKYWQFVTPNPLRLAVLSSDPQDAGRAAVTLKRLGARVDTLGARHVHEGVVSFEITFLRVTH